MTRRTVLVALVAALGSPRLARAQQPERVYRIGWLSTAAGRDEAYNVAFVQRLRELGFVEGRNLVIDFRTAEGRVERLPAVAAELVRRRCDLLFAPGGEPNVAAARQAGGSIPIVIMANDYTDRTSRTSIAAPRSRSR